MEEPDFDQQSFDLGMRCTCTTEANLPHDEGCQYASVSAALRAAYRAGVEEGAKHMDERAREIEEKGGIVGLWMARIYQEEAGRIRELGGENA